MLSSIISSSLAFVTCCLIPLSTAAAVLPAEHLHDMSLARRGNLSTSNALSVLNTNPKLGGWCTFHLTYSVSAMLGYSSFQFELFDADGAGVAFGSPTQRLTYKWGDGHGDNDFSKPPLHFGSRLPYDITVLPHPQENLTWAYNEFSMEIPAPATCLKKDQAPIVVGVNPIVLSVGCFQNNGGYKRSAEPLLVEGSSGTEAGRLYGVTAEIDGGWSC